MEDIKGQVPCISRGVFFKWMRNGWEMGDIMQKMGDITHFKEGCFYVGCQFILISYFLTRFDEW